MDGESECSLSFETIEVGMKVIDQDDKIGIVKECSDIHNILVEYEDGLSGFYCLDKKCDLYDKLFKYSVRSI